MINDKFKIALAAFALVVTGQMFAEEREALSLAPDKTYAGVTDNETSVSYDLVNIGQNKNLTSALRDELIRAKAKYPLATRLTHEYNNSPTRRIVGTAYISVDGRVINYSMRY